MAKSAGANRRTDENKINPGIKITLIVVALLCVVMLAYSAVDALGIIDRNTWDRLAIAYNKSLRIE
jgi:hypothetical protein